MRGYMHLTLVRIPDPVTYIVFNGANRTFTIPSGATSIVVEMIGAGGFTGTYLPAGLNGSTNGGNGGYIKMNLTNLAGLIGTTFIIQAGNSVGLSSSSAPATFITSISSGILLAIAGSGGNGPSLNGSDDVRTLNAGAGGHGGGGVFSLVGGGSYAAGTTGGSTTAISTYNGGGGGTNVGGSGGTVSPPSSGNGTNGNNPSGIQPVSGGAGTSFFNSPIGTMITSAGGGGYAGGGGGAYNNISPNVYAAAGGGGGSSYINNTYVNIISSSSGATLTPSILPGYGRANLGGFISVTIRF
jgi:hypothetical protein